VRAKLEEWRHYSVSYEVFTIPAFDKAVKRLRKKYRRIRVDLEQVVRTLSANPFAGMAIPGFGRRVWKIRLASTDMQVGKRGGYRVIYVVDREEQACYLLYIYAKPERTDMSAQELEALLLELEVFLYGDEQENLQA
jgi:mRNA-degrading endonuclease RelE of RelBE toxin-antitoxin system